MRRISIESLKPGMKLSMPIRDENNNILLNRNVELTSRYITRLIDLGFQSVYISDPDLADVTLEDMLSDQTRHAASRHLNVAFKQLDKIVHDFKNESSEKIIKNLRSKETKRAFGASGVYSNTVRVVENFIEEVVSSAALNGFNSLKTHDNYTYNHSIDVTINAIMIGRKVGLNVKQLQELAVGCLLHDVGKVFISPALLNKDSQLTEEEFEIIKEHPTLGYELIRESVPILQSNVAFQHHERQDGSGYPRGIIGGNTTSRSISNNQLSLYGEIAAVADVYDALNSDRPYRKAILHDLVLDLIKDSAYSHLNAEIVEAFLKIVPRYPAGSNLEIVSGNYSGFKGVVVSINEDNLNTPNIRLLFDRTGKRITPVDIDLKLNFDVQIKLIEA